MKILGIETSCDETAAAVVEYNKETDAFTLLSNITATSLQLHSQTGGIIPETAAREQIKYILPVIHQSLQEAGIKPTDIDAIAVTYGPGLIGSLLVGVETAKTLSMTWNKSIIPVNHLYGHLYVNFLNTPKPEKENFPAIGLVVSGGHTDIVFMKDEKTITWIAGTRDDAAGECFDKCARLLGYDYPGGPKISELAKNGDPKRFHLPSPLPGSDVYDFSFSGLKTAFFRLTQENFPVARNSQEKIGWEEISSEELTSEKKQIVYDLCASLEKTIVDTIIKKTCNAAIKLHAKSIIIGGGVSANQLLIQTFQNKAKEYELSIFSPARNLSTDNGAMIATAAFFTGKETPWEEITADPELYFE